MSPRALPCTLLSMKQPSMLISLMRASSFPDEPCQTTSSDTVTGSYCAGGFGITVSRFEEISIFNTGARFNGTNATPPGHENLRRELGAIYRCEFVSRDHAVERFAVDFHQARRCLLVPARMGQHLGNVASFNYREFRPLLGNHGRHGFQLLSGIARLVFEELLNA